MGDEIRSAGPEHDNDFELMDRSTRSPLLTDDRDSEAAIESQREAANFGLTSANSIRTFGSHDAIALDEDLDPLTTLETAKLGCIFSVLWFAANYFGTTAVYMNLDLDSHGQGMFLYRTRMSPVCKVSSTAEVIIAYEN